MKFNLTYLFSFLLFGITASYGQSDSLRGSKFSGAYFGMVLESPQFQVEGLNDYLKELEMTPFRLPSVVVGVGAQVMHNRLVVQVNFNMGKRKENTDSSFSYSRYNTVGFNIGFDVIRSPRFSLYPFVGFKAYDISYWFTEKLEDDSSFEAYLESDKQFKEVRYSDAHFDVGLGFSYQNFTMFNLRSGVIIPNRYEEWETIDGIALSNGPRVNMLYYVSLVIGFGGNFSEQPYRHEETTPAVYTFR